jgi:hypothetical protein
MRRVLLAVVLIALASSAWAKGKPARRPPATAPKPRPAPEAPPPPRPEARPAKAKVLTFTGLDVEGKLKTPQLLYFFDRVKLELDTTTQQKRSFMKELEESSADKGL